MHPRTLQSIAQRRVSFLYLSAYILKAYTYYGTICLNNLPFSMKNEGCGQKVLLQPSLNSRCRRGEGRASAVRDSGAFCCGVLPYRQLAEASWSSTHPVLTRANAFSTTLEGAARFAPIGLSKSKALSESKFGKIIKGCWRWDPSTIGHWSTTHCLWFDSEIHDRLLRGLIKGSFPSP